MNSNYLSFVFYFVNLTIKENKNPSQKKTKNPEEYKENNPETKERKEAKARTPAAVWFQSMSVYFSFLNKTHQRKKKKNISPFYLFYITGFTVLKITNG